MQISFRPTSWEVTKPDTFVPATIRVFTRRSEEHTSELQSRLHLVCRLLLEKKKKHCPTYPPRDSRRRLTCRAPPSSQPPLESVCRSLRPALRLPRSRRRYSLASARPRVACD